MSRAARIPQRTTVYHLGRAGEVAGGMTQVINGYLEWPFPRVDVEVITSRADPHDHLGALRHSATAAAKIGRLDRDRSVLVAHLSGGGSFVREGLLLQFAARRKIPTIAHLHGSEFADFAAARPGLVGATLRAADGVISLSAESTEVAERFVNPERISLIPNSVPAGADGPKQNLVVFGGSVSHRKGVDVLLAAWERLGDQTDGWELVLAGPLADPSLIRELPRMRLAGSLPHRDLMELLARARIAVLPSRDEAMPMFLLEAMARRACVISTDIGGIAALLGDGAGLVLPPGDVAALYESLGAVLGDASQREAYARAAQEKYASSYSADAVFPAVERRWLSVTDR